MSVAEARKCVCGLIMWESKGVFLCPSEDGIQPQETQINPKTEEAYPRRKTEWDHAHDAHWAKKIAEWFPEQKK